MSQFDPQSQRVATVSADRSIRLWDLLVQKTTVSIDSNHGNVISDCCFTNNGQFLCTASWDKTLKLWDLQAGGFRSHGGTSLQRGHEGSVSCCSFSADANLLVSGSYDRTVAFWDMSSLCLSLILKGHSDWVTDVSVSADRKLVASASKVSSSLPAVILTPAVPELRSDSQLTEVSVCSLELNFHESMILLMEVGRPTLKLLTQCVFCRLRSPSRYRPQPPPLM
uniref:Uncharacterized protein n=1 Tax=Seriola lalandi dorsalis TaxID=1841481 RepID=A0A3B4WGN4_SERLL